MEKPGCSWMDDGYLKPVKQVRECSCMSRVQCVPKPLCVSTALSPKLKVVTLTPEPPPRIPALLPFSVGISRFKKLLIAEHCPFYNVS